MRLLDFFLAHRFPGLFELLDLRHNVYYTHISFHHIHSFYQVAKNSALLNAFYTNFMRKKNNIVCHSQVTFVFFAAN